MRRISLFAVALLSFAIACPVHACDCRARVSLAVAAAPVYAPPVAFAAYSAPACYAAPAFIPSYAPAAFAVHSYAAPAFAFNSYAVNSFAVRSFAVRNVAFAAPVAAVNVNVRAGLFARPLFAPRAVSVVRTRTVVR